MFVKCFEWSQITHHFLLWRCWRGSWFVELFITFLCAQYFVIFVGNRQVSSHYCPFVNLYLSGHPVRSLSYSYLQTWLWHLHDAKISTWAFFALLLLAVVECRIVEHLVEFEGRTFFVNVFEHLTVSVSAHYNRALHETDVIARKQTIARYFLAHTEHFVPLLLQFLLSTQWLHQVI